MPSEYCRYGLVAAAVSPTRSSASSLRQRELRAETKRVMREAYAQLDLARELIFAEAKVVCATAGVPLIPFMVAS